MEKDFDAWNEYKKKLDAKDWRVTFHEREVWWCSVGINIGYEQNANPPYFTRPILILKKWSATTFWGIPLTSQLKEHPSRIKIIFKEIESNLLIDMLRTYDSKRLSHRMGILSEDVYRSAIEKIHAVLPEFKNEIPPHGRGLEDKSLTT